MMRIKQTSSETGEVPDSAGYFVPDKGGSTAGILDVFQGRGSKSGAKETKKPVLRKFTRRSNIGGS